MCEKEVHKSPEFPTKINHSPDTQKKNKEHNKKPTAMFLHSEWQRTGLKSSESETIVESSRTWLWCDICKHWSIPHGTSTHRGPNISKANNNTSKGPERHEECQGNLAEIVVENNNSSNPVMNI
jgi:hypothetical protein